MDSKEGMTSDKDSTGEFCCASSISFFNELVSVYEQGNKALINRVGSSAPEYIALSLFRIGLALFGQYGKLWTIHFCTELPLS